MPSSKEKHCPECYRKLRYKDGVVFCKCGYKPPVQTIRSETENNRSGNENAVGDRQSE